MTTSPSEATRPSRPRRAVRWANAHRKTTASFVLLALLLALNLLAFAHARAMTHFAPAGTRTAAPEELSAAGKVRVLLTGVSVPHPTNRATPADVGLAFESHRIDVAPGEALEAWHVGADERDGPPRGVVLLFHAYAAAKSSLLPAARAFRAVGFDALLVDFRGSGGSTGDDTTIGYRDADDVAAAFAHARARWPDRRVVLYGQSMGAVAVLRAAARGTVAPDALVLESPFDRMLSTVDNRFRSMNLPAFPLARLLVFWGGVRHGYWGFAHNPAEYAARVAVPTLLFHGGRDRRVTTEEATRVADALAGPKRFVVVEEARHAAFVDDDGRARWSETVAAFLAEHR